MFDYEYRFVMQDLRNVLARVLSPLPRFVYVLHFSVQHNDENLLYRIHCIHHLLDAIQEALLYSKWEKHFNLHTRNNFED